MVKTYKLRCIMLLLFFWYSGSFGHNSSEEEMKNGKLALQLIGLIPTADVNPFVNGVELNFTDYIGQEVIISENIQQLDAEEESEESEESEEAEERVDSDITDITKFPFMVSVQYEDNHHCGGALIKENFVLSAARCFPHKLNPYSVLAGTNEGLEFKDHKFGQRLKAKRAYLHDNFNFQSNPNDIALLELDGKFNLSPKIALISLATPEENGNKEVTELSKECTLVAFEYIDDIKGVKRAAEIHQPLVAMTIPTINLKECQSKVTGYEVTSKQFCTKNANNKHMCIYTGGPAVWKGKGGYVLQGVISYSADCGQKGEPLVMTRVDAYTEWIERKITASSDYLRRLHKSANVRTQPACFLIAFIATFVIANIN